jgi:hypothetical protein
MATWLSVSLASWLTASVPISVLLGTGINRSNLRSNSRSRRR